MIAVNSSAFLLNRTLQHHLDRFNSEDPEFVSKLKESFYVDDLVSEDTTTERAFMLYRKVKDKLASGVFKLRKWTSNCN